jgi:hypothetical protein
MKLTVFEYILYEIIIKILIKLCGLYFWQNSSESVPVIFKLSGVIVKGYLTESQRFDS